MEHNLKTQDLKVKSCELYQPDENELIKRLKIELGEIYESVLIESIPANSIDLTEEPYSLSKSGMGGNPSICDVGG